MRQASAMRNVALRTSGENGRAKLFPD
uniref:Uncharacterized protein n=1 Tax=Zea mays TaxID=4577 RepID=C4J884_MAIZE|nr:unknown [Zea mays]